MKSTLLPIIALFSSLSAHAIDIQRWRTPQGAQVQLVERHELPIVDFAIAFQNAGSSFEPAGKSDIAQPTSQMIMRGTRRLNEEQFNAAINDLGSIVSGSSDAEHSIFTFRSRTTALQPTAQLFAQALAAPRFDAAVLKRLQNRAVLSLQQAQSYPSYLTAREQTRLDYPNHPYGIAARRTEQSIRAVTLADLRRFHQNHYTARNAMISIVGDISRSNAQKLVQQILQNLPHPKIQDADIPPVPLHTAQTSRIPFAHSTQTQISIGLPVLKYDDPDFIALSVGNYILGGGGFDSRLMKELRDKYGYTYGAHSSFSAYRQAGPFNISFTTEHKNAEAALAATRKVLADFIVQGPTEAELKQAKAHITGSFPLSFDSNQKLLGILVSMALHNRPADWLDTYTAKVNALTAADIKNAWQRHIRPEQLNTVITGSTTDDTPPKAQP